jgi:hypothetical protein
MYWMKNALSLQRMDAVGSDIGDDRLDAVVIPTGKVQLAVIVDSYRHVLLTLLRIQE